MEISIELVQSDQEIVDLIHKELYEYIKKIYGVDVILRNNELANLIKNIIIKNIQGHPTFISLLNNSAGELLPELGLPFKIRQWAADSLPNIVAEGIEMISMPTIVNDGISIDTTVMWSNERMQELINNGFASYVSQGKNGTKTSIDWLDWLINDGATLAVTRFHIVYGEGLKGSRTGKAVMKPGGSWELPPQWRGTMNDNFITQSIEKSVPEILELMANKI